MNKTWLLIGGLGLGAGLMYALDPDRGGRRRAQALAQARAYRRQTNALLGQTRRALGRTTHGLSHTTRSLGQTTRGLGQQMRDLLAQASTPFRYERWSDDLWPTRAEAGQAGATTSLLMLGCVGLGVGLMYLLDPNTGKRRRALVRDTAQSYWQKTGDRFEKTARDARNRTRGVIAETRTRLRGAEIPADPVLEARVRAQLGRVVANAGAIGVTAQQGHIVLSGPVGAEEVENLLTSVEAVPGVTEVQNQLHIHQDTQHRSGTQSHNSVG